MNGLHYEHIAKSRKSFYIKGEISIGVPHEKIWEIISTPQHLEQFHPFVKNHRKGRKWNGIGSEDSGEFYSGKEMNREVVQWNEGKGFTVKLNNKDGNDTQVLFEILKISSGESIFSVSITTDSYRKIPRPIWPIFVRFLLVPSYKKYLYSILNGMKFYAETGKKVKKNQFGKHRKFSP